MSCQLKCILIIAGFLLMSGEAFADNSAAAITPKGLQFTSGRNITFVSEDVYISERKIIVTQAFNNNSDQAITIPINFPIPSYSYSDYWRLPNFSDFKAEVNGKTIMAKKAVKAYFNGKDCTAVLNKFNVNIEKFGNDDIFDQKYLKQLNSAQINELKKLNVLDAKRQNHPNWKVAINYHWLQVFPAHQTVTIKYSYEPQRGSKEVDLVKDKESILKLGCIKDSQLEKIKELSRLYHEYHYWIDYGEVFVIYKNLGKIDFNWINAVENQMSSLSEMLSDDYSHHYSLYANMTWIELFVKSTNVRQPLKNFHLVIDKVPEVVLGICFTPNLICTDYGRCELSLKNFIPRQNLQVYFFNASF